MKPLVIFLAALSIALSFSWDTDESGNETPVRANAANNFLNSLGANSAISSRGERLEKTIEIVKYTGIRWIRSGYEGDVGMEDYLKLHRETGILFSYGLMSGGTDIPRLLDDGHKLADAGALLAFEGSNEPNNWALTYQGEKGGGNLSWLPVAKLQRDLYKSVKADTKLKKYAVWSLCENGAQTDNTGLQYLEIPNGAGALLPDGTKYADYATVHNYFLHPSNPGLYDNQTWNAADPGSLCKVDGLYGNYGLTWGKKFKGYSEEQLEKLPKVTTETGVTIGGDVTEDKQARMYLNMFLSQFKRGWSYTSVYLLRDRSDEAGNQSFGLYKADYTPRKSAVYLHNLTSILADKPSSKKLSTLEYSLGNAPETVHDLLLQNSNGKFQLVVWNERAKGSDEVTVNLGKKVRQVKVYDPTLGVTPIQLLKNTNHVNLVLTDHPVILEF